MRMIGYQELIIIFLIVLLLFGGSKIPELARGLGKGIREFKKAKDDIRDAIEKEEPGKTAEKTAEKKDLKPDSKDKDSGKIS
ncbi:MAG: twin-arginine translocase TatA/TatE family subunit [Lentisphaerae bacterium]|nr:twin-arginine translocase TatA/TatE family subunit [Lentisphaerota bacterium]